ncbi:hypothetical protein Vretimale_17936, partial [Volvox reticuliferus]
MRYCGAGKTEGHTCFHDPLDAVDVVDPCCTQPASASIAWAVRRPQHGQDTFLVSMECHTRRDWAVKRAHTAGHARSPTPTRDSFIHRGWAYKAQADPQQSSEVGDPSHKIVLYHNPLSDWASGVARSRLRGRGASIKDQLDLGVFKWAHESAGGSAPAAVSRQEEGYKQAAEEPLQQKPPPLPPPSAGQRQEQQQQQQQTPTRPWPATHQAVPYSVPTLAIGDVFLSCNTIAGLEHADDWEFGAAANSSGRSVAGRSAVDAGSAGAEAEAGLAADGAAPAPASPVSQPTQHKPHAAAATTSSSTVGVAAVHRRSPLDPASELLLRMSSIIGGQRLMFVSKESAELVRRALLLSRYDEIMAERRATAAEVSWEEDDEATVEGTHPVLLRSTTATSAVATRTRAGPAVSSAVHGSGAGSGWGSGGGKEGAARSPSFAPWLRNRSKGREDPVPTRASLPGAVTTSIPLQVNDASSTSSPNHANGGDVALLDSSNSNKNNKNSSYTESGSGGGNGSSDNGSSHSGIDGSSHAQDGMQLELPGWMPGPLRDAAGAAVRGVSGWLMHGIGGGAAGGSGMGSLQQGVIAVFRRGVSGDGSGGGDVVDVSAGPRPRLPAQPLTGVMPLPKLPQLKPAATITENAEDARRLQQLGGDGGVLAAAAAAGIAGGVGGSGPKDVRHDSDTSKKSVADRPSWDSGALMRELKQLEEQKVIADAEALLKAGKRGAAGGGEGEGGFLPPFSFSSYVARLPLEAALKAILSTTVGAPAEAATGDTVTAPVRRRFLLVPDSVDEQAVEGSREVDRLVAEIEAAAAEAVGEAAGEVSPGSSGDAAAAAGGTVRGTSSVHGRRIAPRPRVALNLYDSDASHWVLDVVDELEQEADEAASKGNSSSVGGSVGSGSNNQQLSLTPERFIRGTPSGPSDDLGGLVPYPGPLEPASSTSYDTQTQATAGARASAAATATATSSSSNSSTSCSDGSSTNSGGGGGGRTPVFLLPGVTVSVRAADGTLLRLRPAFMSLQQLAAALAMARDAVAASWRRQRSAARWRVVSALDVLTVHSAGFPVVRFPPPSSITGGGASAGGGGGGGDEDSDDGIPEAKELLREMGAGNRRPSAIDTAAAAAVNSPEAAPRGVLGVLSTLAVGVVSFSAWCLVSAVDVWEDMYSRTPWGLEEIGVPQHVNVTPTYLEEHVRHLAEVNAPAVAAAANNARSRAVQRTLEKRARRRQRNTQGPDQQQPPPAPPPPDHELPASSWSSSNNGAGEVPTVDEQRPGGAKTTAAYVGSGSGSGVDSPINGAPAPSGARSGAVIDSVVASVSEHGRGAAPPPPAGADASSVAAADSPGSAAASKGHRAGQRQRGSAAAAAAAAALATFSGLSLQTETMAGLTVLLQFTWAAARAAHTRALKEADGIFGSNAGGGAVDGLLRLAGGRGSRDGGFAAGGGGGGLTLTASQDGELGLVAKLDIRPIASAALPAAAAAAAAGKVAAGGAAADDAASTPSSSSAAAAPSAGSVKPGGLLIRELSPTGHSGARYELLQSSGKLASQVTRPHKFEVGFHLNMRKLLGDLSEDAPDQLLKLQQPAGPMPSGSGGGSGSIAAAATATAAASGRRASGPGQAAPTPEAYGLLLIGDLGFEGLEEGTEWMRPPSLGFADLGGLLKPPGAAASHLGLTSSAAAAALVGDAVDGDGSSEEYSGSDGGAG